MKGQDKTTHFYDKIFKYLFTNVDFVVQLIKFAVPRNLLKKIDWNTIKSEKVSFVPKDLRSREADAIYGAKLKNGKEIYLYFIIEFQTYVDRFMALRLYIYIALFYHKLMNENRIKGEVPIILPIVLYTGDRLWNAGISLESLMNKEVYKEVSAYVPNMKYILIDKNRYKDEELERMRDIMSGILYIEKMGGEDIEERLGRFWEIFAKGMEEREVEVLKEYISALFNHKFDIRIDEAKIRRAKKSEEVIKVFSTAVDEWREKLINTGRQEGIQEGLQKGIQEGLQKGLLQTTKEMLRAGIELDIVHRVTKLSRRKILELKKKIENNN